MITFKDYLLNEEKFVSTDIEDFTLKLGRTISRSLVNGKNGSVYVTKPNETADINISEKNTNADDSNSIYVIESAVEDVTDKIISIMKKQKFRVVKNVIPSYDDDGEWIENKPNGVVFTKPFKDDKMTVTAVLTMNLVDHVRKGLVIVGYNLEVTIK